MLRIVARKTLGFGGPLLVVALAVACGANEGRKGAPTEITSAPAAVKAPRTAADVARLERERDEAQAKLQQEISRHDEDRARSVVDAEERRSRTELAGRLWQMVDAVDEHLTELQQRAVRAPSKDRRRVETGIVTARQKLAVLELAAREIVSDHDIVWLELKRALEVTILDLQRTVRSISE